MKILLDGRPNPEGLFADLDETAASNELEPGAETDRIPQGFKALTQKAGFAI